MINKLENETIKDKVNETEYYDSILEKVEEEIKYYNTSKLDNGGEEFLKTEKMNITFTTIDNQKNNTDNDYTIIDFGECEISLRNFYNISNESTIYVKKIDIFQEGMRIPKIEYELYSKLNGINLEKLNLSLCNNNKIILYMPVEINENLDKLNTSSGYFNDICYTSTSDSGTDITINDRQNEFIEKNKTVCQDGCILDSYDYRTKRAKCSCDVKEKSFSFIDMNINTTDLFNNFKDIKNKANFNLLGCYKSLFSVKGILYNKGSYIIIVIIIIHIIDMFIFYLKQLNIILSKINDIMNEIKNSQMNDVHKKKKKRKSLNKENIIVNNFINDINDNKIITLSGNKKKKKIKNKKIFQKKNIKKQKKNNKIISNVDAREEIPDSNNNIIKSISIKDKNEKKEANIINYNNDELNMLTYDLALRFDKRTYLEYYISLLKSKHIFIFSFLNNNDYNSKIIKIDLFFVGFTISYTVNALFFNDDTMHHIYIRKGSFDLEYELPKICYSSLISLILNMFLKMLAISNNDIIHFKHSKTKEDINQKRINLESELKIKFNLYFIISFIFLSFFWYYVSMFGAIYRNTQLHLIKDTLISFGLSLIYPFAIYLLPGLFRIPALTDPEKKKICLFEFSKFLQIF